MSKTLFLGKRSVSEGRVSGETTHLARFERLIDQANSYLEWLPPAEHPSESITYSGMAVANLAFAFLLTGTARARVSADVGQPMVTPRFARCEPFCHTRWANGRGGF